MNETTSELTSAFMNGKSKKMSNTKTDGRALYLCENKIAEHRQDGLYITNAGWTSRVTKERLNGLPNVSISQVKGKWHLNGNLWDGDWIKVSDGAPPPYDEVKAKKVFDLSKTWISSDGWRGYEQPRFAVCGVNDTGNYDDSPCSSDVAKKEITEVINTFKTKAIPTKLVTCQTSNVFCVHHYLVVPPDYKDEAISIVEEHLKNVDTNLLYTI